MDVRKLTFPDNFFDCICSFEVMEHLEDYDKYLMKMSRVLKPCGHIILSTPNAAISHVKKSHTHFKEFDTNELSMTLRGHFDKVELFGQSIRSKVIKYTFEAETYRNDLIKSICRLRYRLGIQRLVPLSLKILMERFFIKINLWKPSFEDYEISQDNVDKARMLIAICKKFGR